MSPQLPAEPLFVGPPDEPDRYRITKRITAARKAGEAILYRGAAVSDGQEVAIKQLREQIPNVDWIRSTWMKSVKALEDARHPSLVKVIDGFSGDEPHPQRRASEKSTTTYLVMEYVFGDSYEIWAAKNPRDLRPLRDVALALDYLHNHVKHVHGDVKPANIKVTHDDLVDTATLVDLTLLRPINERSTCVVDAKAYTETAVKLDEPYQDVSDLHGFAATIFYGLVGHEPPTDGSKGPSGHDLAAIDVERTTAQLEAVIGGPAVGQISAALMRDRSEKVERLEFDSGPHAVVRWFDHVVAEMKLVGESDAPIVDPSEAMTRTLPANRGRALPWRLRVSEEMIALLLDRYSWGQTMLVTVIVGVVLGLIVGATV